MYLGFLIHLKLVVYIVRISCSNCLLYLLSWFKRIFYYLCYFTSGVWVIKNAVKYANYNSKSKQHRKQAVIILTKISAHDFPPPVMTGKIGKQNAFFLERIMTEKLAFELTQLKHRYDKDGKELSLYVCYQDRYFLKQDIKDWLEHLPNYSKRLTPLKKIRSDIDKRFEKLKESFENNFSRLDLSFDADSFCIPKEVPCKKAKKSIFKYVCVEDTEDGHALEAAIRVGFYHDNQDIVVLNPHAVEMKQTHIIDALSYLENNSDIKNRLIYGKTKSGGLYLLGVSRSRETLLNIRRLTQDVIWGSETAFDVILEHQNQLKWSDACLLDVLDDVNGFESLPLIERELGLKMEHIPSDMISVIIPTYNHEEYIQETLESLIYHLSGKRQVQIIAVDANSTDYTLKKMEKFRDNLDSYIEAANDVFPYRGHSVKLHNSNSPTRSRRNHNNSGINNNSTMHNSTIDPSENIDWKKLIDFQIYTIPSEYSQTRDDQVQYAVENLVEGGTLLVLRPGTNLPLYWDISIRKCLNQLGVVMGTFSFHLHLQDRYIARKHIGWALRCVFLNFLFNWRSHQLEMPSGDQGYFMYTYYYQLILSSDARSDQVHLPPGLDDVALLDQVKEAGHISTSPATVTVCPIKSLRFGFLRTWLLDTLMLIAYRLGAPPQKLGRYSHEMIVLQPDYYDGY